MISPKLVVGLKNPDPEYTWTRHNVGAQVVKAFAKQHSFVFHNERGCLSSLAKKEFDDTTLFLALPSTYMNESGKAVQRVLQFLKIGVEHLLVIVDDIESRWGQVTLAYEGGTRGHNGLKSLHALLGSKQFTQMRVGVGRPEGKDVADYVLQRFSASEMSELPTILEKAISMIEEWFYNQVRQERGEKK